MKKNILITGITGQDGVFITEKILSLNKETNIYGFTRGNRRDVFFKNINFINKNLPTSNIHLINHNILDFEVVDKVIKDTRPMQIFNLSGPSSVYDSYIDPVKTDFEIYTIFNNLLNSIIKNKLDTFMYQASSSEMFGTNSGTLDEESKFNPLSPYAKSKLKVHNEIQKIRNLENVKISSGIMFNHESEFRNNNYLIMKIILKALSIKNNEEGFLKLGSLRYERDWSYAKDISEAMYLIAENELSEDYVIGSGKTHSIKDVVEFVFNYLKIDWENKVIIDKELLRKNDPVIVGSNPRKIELHTNWKPKVTFEEMLYKCITYKLNNY